MKVAFASSDKVHINAHFGWAKQFELYEVSEEGYNFLHTVEFTGDLKEDGNEDKLVPKMEAVADCSIVYVSSIGGSAASRLIQQKITPIKAKTEEDTIEGTLNELIAILKGNPPPWLRKAIQQSKKSFDFVTE
jgi:nitrogen fixation protein NifX